MGKYKKGILGHFRGIVGTVIGSVWRGIHYMKSLPDVGADNPTPAQINVRAKLALVTAFVQRLKTLITVGYQSFTKGITPMNAATGYHLKNAVTGTSAANYAINYALVRFSVGSLSADVTPLVTPTAGAKLDFSWTDDTDPEEDPTGSTDLVTVLAYSIEKDKFARKVAAAPRSAEAYVLQLPLDWSADNVHTWISFVSANGKQVSNSVYTGEVLVL
ncbi:DUF6266 family protein [Pedobacter africanus]|uniref:Uncharacterized protein n=1 Tax=Pedobacter africanus TaxID=151894 RepID=A0A1W2B028_9SPHI|nr:DUF6266 family protein [Pedobacter africanus]SMC66347.1 hypothetical protein SAMN04488524_1820 [Pedobacter africanus]